MLSLEVRLGLGLGSGLRVELYCKSRTTVWVMGARTDGWDCGIE